jgi:hypothetical protein
MGDKKDAVPIPGNVGLIVVNRVVFVFVGRAPLQRVAGDIMTLSIGNSNWEL